MYNRCMYKSIEILLKPHKKLNKLYHFCNLIINYFKEYFERAFLMKTIETNLKSFWNYVRDFNKVASIETVFEEWVNKTAVPFNEAIIIWASIKESIDSSFFDRKALIVTEEKTKEIFNRYVELALAFLKENRYTFISQEKYESMVNEYIKVCNEYLMEIDNYLREHPADVLSKSTEERFKQIIPLFQVIFREVIYKGLHDKFEGKGDILLGFLEQINVKEIVKNWINSQNVITEPLQEESAIAKSQRIQSV